MCINYPDGGGPGLGGVPVLMAELHAAQRVHRLHKPDVLLSSHKKKG